MIKLDSNQSSLEKPSWQSQLDRFVEAHRPELAALAWGLRLQWGEQPDTLGIDLKPTPHFVPCPKSAIEQLNVSVENRLQELLGIVDGYQPEKEVILIGIGFDRVKLIYFESNPTPPDCFEQIGKDVDTLLKELEDSMNQMIKL
ncbi:hypothetical protein PCC9214_02346 [Planktothrix tepida]|uniref:Chaperone protein CcmS domain-containing protein n=2 Tax=Planktothrix TaxID=54304 RepID=A0A1J1LLA5_9CYAN|nr:MULTISPECIES: hypothetical protein [Planktothrix]CAD5947660.1 hypothetical protein PCC9214_02346 [Planktothrix tepida]CAD5963233.1 hypothetical protein NO713_03337 [Planktothrix pseudagardhii]CUR32393.1 conserved hypothetical protein [Planktothrix tepida PCC 9214]